VARLEIPFGFGLGALGPAVQLAAGEDLATSISKGD